MFTEEEKNRKSQDATKRSPLKFILLVFAFSIPFWYLGLGGAKLTDAIPINLPVSALGFVCTLSAALILTYKESKSRGAVNLLMGVFDYKRTSRKAWFVPSILVMPAIMMLMHKEITSCLSLRHLTFSSVSSLNPKGAFDNFSQPLTR
jgi:hypothetical protein